MEGRQHQMRELPRLWLVTDERQGDALLASVAALPERSGILFRHYRTSKAERLAMYQEVRNIAWNAGHVLMLSDSVATAYRWQADGIHLPSFVKNKRIVARYARQRSLLVCASAHDEAEVRTVKAVADFIFVSPIFPTRSHPGQDTLGLEGLAVLARRTWKPVIAMGGVDAAKFDDLAESGAYGWAAIDALTQS